MAGHSAQQIVTGSNYVEQITALESDRRARAAFLNLVVSIARPGAALLDFGAGPGIDARFYVEHGFTVEAYDVDANMRAFFTENCRDLIEAGSVSLESGSYRDFLARHRDARQRHIDLVTANFAPLNLIAELNELFAAFHALTTARGSVLASVLNPYFIGDLRYKWWWRNVLRLWLKGDYTVQGAQAPIVRRRLATFAAQSAPYFLLERVFAGLPAKYNGHAYSADLSAGCAPAWSRLTTCRFMFLLFRKVALQSRAVAGASSGAAGIASRLPHI